MRAARFRDPEEGLVVEEVDRPDPGPGEVLLEVAACGLCRGRLSPDVCVVSRTSAAPPGSSISANTNGPLISVIVLYSFCIVSTAPGSVL